MTRCVPDSGPVGSWRCTGSVVGGIEPVGAPLPHVAGHVVQTEAVRWERVDRRRAGVPVGRRVVARERALEDVHPVFAIGFEVVAPRVHRRRATATRGVLPLGLRGQPSAGPPAVRLGVVPRDVDDRMIAPGRRARNPDRRGGASRPRAPGATTARRRRRGCLESHRAGSRRTRTTTRSVRPRSRNRSARRTSRNGRSKRRPNRC